MTAATSAAWMNLVYFGDCRDTMRDLTAQVSQALGRQWIGCELNPEYGAAPACAHRSSGDAAVIRAAAFVRAAG